MFFILIIFFKTNPLTLKQNAIFKFKFENEQKALDETILPPLLKKFSWTKAAPYKEEKHQRSTAESIGNNFTPTAASVSIKHLPPVVSHAHAHPHTHGTHKRSVSNSSAGM